MIFNQIQTVFKLAMIAEYERSLEADEVGLLSDLFDQCDESQKEILREMTYRLCELIECK